MTQDRQQHWDGVYATRTDTELSWSQSSPGTSLRLVRLAAGDRAGASVVDVGAGTSTLVDGLLDRGHDVTVLDVSDEALATVAARLGPRADQVARVRADLLDWRPERTYDVWHDRAVLHFLTEPADVADYVELVTTAVAPGGAVVLGVFAADGPSSCSGLTTSRYTARGLSDLFAAAFVLEQEERELHRTPWGATQAFTWVVFRRR